MADQTIAHYRIGAKLGEGGMGEVYQATDTKLQREVALKFLPDDFTGDPETLERFRREARALATLSHPNIGAIHGIEESDGRVALVLELIEGDTLADRIATKTLSRDEALDAAEQIACALEAAHAQGIVHRDLKPANIKITPEGQVKVLDFGLAKSTQREVIDATVDESPTVMMTVAQPGTVMGTAPYMSPEQAKGQPIDRRADIWAYGAVLFEMLTGRRLFQGRDVTEVVAAVISTRPDLSRLPGDLPPWLGDIVARCLRRDLTMRLPHISAARIALQEGDGGVAHLLVASARTAKGGTWLGLAVTLLAGLAIGTLGSRMLVQPDSAPAPTTYSELVFDPPPVPGAFPSVSPDGRLMVYVGGDDDNARMIYIRRLGDGTTLPMPGSEFADMPAFSPDGGSIAFVAAGRLMIARLGGGQPEALATVAGGSGGIVWLPDDTIVFAALGSRPLLRIPADGSTAPQIVDLGEHGADELWISNPARLPDPRTLLVAVRGSDGGESSVAVASLADGSLKIIAKGSNPRFVASSTLVFLQRRSLVAAPFDPGSLTITGPERRLSPPGAVLITQQGSAGDTAVAGVYSTGTALFPMELAAAREVVWVDSSGNETSTGLVFDGAERQSFAANGAAGVALSPDETRVTLIASDVPVVVALDDIEQRRTLPRPGTGVAYANWLPDGEAIFVSGNQTGDFRGYTIAVAGGRQPEMISPLRQSIPTSSFPDGRKVLGYVITAETARDLWTFNLDGEDELVLRTDANERAPMISPDARAFAYVSNESGMDRVYLRLYPDVGQAWPISDDHGSAPRWSRDGSELYYRQESHMMAMSINLEDGVRTGTARELFAVGAYEEDPFGNALYDVAADGRFLMVRLGIGPRTWRWIQDWGTDLDALVETNE